jgi:hypothetical protein
MEKRSLYSNRSNPIDRGDRRGIRGDADGPGVRLKSMKIMKHGSERALVAEVTWVEIAKKSDLL